MSQFINPKNIRKTCYCGLSLALLQPVMAIAQTAKEASTQTRALDEVIVTARRDLESAQKVPLSMIVLDEKTLEQKSVRNPNDLSSVAPGLSIQNTAANRQATTFSIRAQGTTFGQSTPGVIAYFADVPDFSTRLYDLSGVQVLKGPQGTLFGRNSNGGAILFTPKEPTENFEGYVSARVGNYNRLDYEAAVGGALIPDMLRARFSTQRIDRSGLTKDMSNGGWADNENRSSYRFSMIFQPVENFENYFIYQYENANESGSGMVIGKVVDSGVNSNLSLVSPFFPPLNILPQLQAALAQQDAAGPRKMFVTPGWGRETAAKSRGLINTTTWDLNDTITLKNIVSYRHYDSMQSYDLDGTPVAWLQVSNPYGDQGIVQRTEEFQVQGHFDKLESVLGYYHESNSAPMRVGFNTVQLIFLGAKNFGYSDNGSSAYFGQAKYSLTDDLELTAGVRYTKDERKTFGQTQTFSVFAAEPTGPTASAAPAQKTNFYATTWNVTAAYTLSPDANIYGTVRKGYRAGGFNGSAPAPELSVFDPEYVTDYEVGVKTSWRFDEWLVRANAAVFYDNYIDIQRFVNLQTTPAATIVENAAKGKTKGAEFDIFVSPSPLFDMSLAYTFIDGKYDSYDDPSMGDLSKSKFPNTPRHQVTFTPVLHVPVSEEVGKVALSANIYSQSKIASDPANVANGNRATDLSALGATIPGYSKVDLRADWSRIYGSNFSAAAYVLNAADKLYKVGNTNQLAAVFGVESFLYGLPRMYGVEVKYAFGN